MITENEMKAESKREDASPKQTKRGGFRRADRVREVILDVALEAFSSTGFVGTSTRSIAKQAGVQHSLVNYHFENKENLWIAAMDRVLRQLTSQVYAEIGDAQHLSASEQLRRFVEVYAKTAATSPQVFRILTQQSTQNSSRLDWLMDNYLREQFKRVTKLIAEAQKEGKVIEGAPEHVFYLIIGGVGMFFAVTRGYTLLTGRSPSSAAEMHRLIAFLCGIIFKDG